MRRTGKFNPLFMAASIDEVGLNFPALLSASRRGPPPPQGVGAQSILFSHDAADEEECDALCREFRSAAARALKESAVGASPTLADLPRTSPQMDAPPVLADGVVNSPPFSSRCTFHGSVRINSTCNFRGDAADGDDGLVELCDRCVVVQSLGEGCFPSLFNTISCVGDKTCLFDSGDYNYGACKESVMYLPVFRNAPTADGCDNWVQESIAVPIGCSCSLLRDRYSPLRAEK
uniref:Spore coat protein Z n=1 Tax=Steinernema glaseri TaxID=37863 RepID=A0A1I7ZEP1_9BILA